MRGGASAAALVFLGLVACAGAGDLDAEQVQEVAVGVITLQGGTISELRGRSGEGPFRRYEVSPDEMLDVVSRAARRAEGPNGRPLETVWVRRPSREVVAKEPAPDAKGSGYTEPWRSAMVARVQPIAGEPDASRVEIHAMDKGPFHRGRIDWERDMPRWIDEVLAEPRLYPGGIQPIR